MALVWKEVPDSVEPGQASFTIEGGGKQGVYMLEPEDPEDLLTAITEVLGDTAIPPGDGRLTRTLPVCHPQYPWLYASSIDSVKGVGTPDPWELADANEELECAPITSQYVLYQQYQYTIKFTPRPYAVVGDDNIDIYDGQWYDFDGNLQTFGYADEWSRFTDFTLMPQNDFITAQQGQMKFVTQGNVSPGGTAYTGNPRMLLPNQIYKLIWMAVPLRYLTSANSYLQQGFGCVNQNAWYGYSKGQLLFVSYTPTRYTPPKPREQPFATVNGGTVFSTEKLCNIEFNFLYTNRDNKAGSLPAAPTTGNRNFVIGGHNLMPWLGTRRFYFSESSAQVGGQPAGVASFFSYPFERLFTDPDVI